MGRKDIAKYDFKPIGDKAMIPVTVRIPADVFEKLPSVGRQEFLRDAIERAIAQQESKNDG